ncbi:NAD(P)/FAD-dependent oxidoreductase [Cupriavidus sp. 8B]
MHRVVIVGGGAGGLELATKLGDTLGKRRQAHITLVDKCPTHVWKPLLHEVAAGSLDPATNHLEYAAQAHWHNFTFARGELVGLDRSRRSIRLAAVPDEDGGDEPLFPARELEYDTLVLAVGSTTHFFGIAGAEEHAISLDSVWQAERFRRRLLRKCAQKSDGRARGVVSPVKVVIIGAGATGVELAAELKKTAKAFRDFRLHGADERCDIHITLVEAGTRILPALSERVSEATARLLRGLGVDIMTGDSVMEVHGDRVSTRGGATFPADITVWAAGIKGPAVMELLDGLALNRLVQLNVTTSLQSETDPNVFALGDCASCLWEKGRFVPPRAQAAHQQASFMVNAIKCRIRGDALPTFSYRDLGSLVSVGSSGAVGNLMGGLVGRSMLVEGLMARAMYASLYRMHLSTISGYRRMLLDLMAHRLRRFLAPRVKLH